MGPMVIDQKEQSMFSSSKIRSLDQPIYVCDSQKSLDFLVLSFLLSDKKYLVNTLSPFIFKQIF